MAITSDGRLFVDQGFNRGTAPGILVFDADGTYVTGFGANGQLEVNLAWPTGMLLLDGDLIVADVANTGGTGEAKLVRFQLLPPLAP
jgi:hypothetical protein